MCAAVAGPERSPIRYKVDGTAGLVIIEVLSIEDGPALLSALRGVRADLSFRASFDVCVDCNTLRAIPSGDDVKRLARACVACPHDEAPKHWALIATWRPLYDAARFFATAVSAPNVTLRVFHAWSDARVWLAAMKPAVSIDTPWVGPSRTLNQILQQPTGARR